MSEVTFHVDDETLRVFDPPIFWSWGAFFGGLTLGVWLGIRRLHARVQSEAD